VKDAALLLPLLDGMPAVAGRRGLPRRRPNKLHADKAHDHKPLRAQVRRRGISVRIARKGPRQPRRGVLGR
jgi:hypothetical protein